MVGPTGKSKADKMEVTAATTRLQRLAVTDKAAAVANGAIKPQTVSLCLQLSQDNSLKDHLSQRPELAFRI